MLQRKLTRTLEPRMIWWALQNHSGRNWKRITTVYKRILILYTKKWATNWTKQLKKWKEYQREWPQVGKWGRDCGAERSTHRIQNKLIEEGQYLTFWSWGRRGRDVFKHPTQEYESTERTRPCIQHRTWSQPQAAQFWLLLHSVSASLSSTVGIFATIAIQHAMSQPLQFIRREKRHQQQE